MGKFVVSAGVKFRARKKIIKCISHISKSSRY